MQAHDVLRARSDGGDLVDVEIRRVGREDRAGFADRVELGEDLLLHVHVLENRLDDEVAIGERVQFQGRRQRAHRLPHLFGGHAALGGGRLVVLEHDARAAVERILLRLDDDDRDARRQEVHRDAAAHRPRADNADLGDLAWLHVLGDAFDLRRLALGEEEILLRPRLCSRHQFHEQAALLKHALFVRMRDGSLDRLDVGFRSVEALHLAGVRLTELVEKAGVFSRGRELLVARAADRDRAHVLDLMGVGDRVLHQIAFDELVDQPQFLRLDRADRSAARHHIQRLFDADDAGQPLRSARAGEQPQLNLGHAELGVLDRNSPVAGERDLEPAAERGPMHRGDYGFRAGLDRVDDRREHRKLHRLAELQNIRAREERLAFAANDDRLDLVIRGRLLDRGDEALADREAQRVDGRVVRGDDQHVHVPLGGDDAHAILLRFPMCSAKAGA